MKIFSKDELQELADAEFEKHNVTEFFGTTDGQLFYKEGFAKRHAGDNGTVYHLTGGNAAVSEKDAAPKPPSIAVLTGQLETITDTEELNKILQGEIDGANRKGAIAAIELRILNVTLETIEDKDGFAALLEAEKSGPKRKEAIAAIEARIQKLTA